MTTKSRFPWKAFFQRSPSAVFVLGANRRLRYANPAWETLTGKSFAALRGTRISANRESASPLWKALAPPLEVWNGTSMQVRRARPEVEYGPPWWDISFAPLAQPHGNAVIGFLSQVGETPERHAFREPETLAAARAEHARWYSLELFAGSTPVMQCLQQQLRMAAQVHAPVWMRGEPGSGKETAARVIHYLGPDREKAFVAIDCKGLQPYLIEQLCFGRGGFRHSKAVGTLLMKSPEVLPRDMQLRFVEWSETQAAPRFLSSSTSPIGSGHVVAGFPATLVVEIPPLRERLDELPRMVQHFALGDCDESIWPALCSHAWPGNIRELRTVMNKAAKNAAGAAVTAEHMPQHIRERLLIANAPPVKLKTLKDQIETFEREVIESTLANCGKNTKVAAGLLNVPTANLLKRMKALGIES